MLFWYFYDTCPIFAETILPTSKALSSCIFHSFLMYPKTVRSSSDVGKMTRLLFFTIESQITTQYCYIKHYVHIHNKKANLDFISLMTCILIYVQVSQHDIAASKESVK